MQTATLDLLKQVVGTSQKEQNNILIALLKKKGLPIATITILIGLNEDQIKKSKGFTI